MSKKSRRNVIKGLAITAPAVWAKPVVKGIVLPAHAAASSCPLTGPVVFTLTGLPSAGGDISLSVDGDWAASGTWNGDTGAVSITSNTIPDDCSGSVSWDLEVIFEGQDDTKPADGVQGSVEIDWDCCVGSFTVGAFVDDDSCSGSFCGGFEGTASGICCED